MTCISCKDRVTLRYMIGSISRALIQRCTFSVSQSLLHHEVLNTALSAGEEGWRLERAVQVPFYSAEVKSKVENTVCTCM